MRVISALLGLTLMSGSALAADLLEPVVPVEPIAVVPEAFTWTGGFVGVDVGWAFGAGGNNGNGNDLVCLRDRHDVRDRDRRRDRDGRRNRDGDGLDGDGDGIALLGHGRQNRGGGGGQNCVYGDSDNVDELRGMFAGVHAGFLFQSGMFVGGVEGDLKWANIDTGNDDQYYGRNNFDRDHGIEIDWFGTARLSAGVAFDRVLVYGTGGLAFGGVDVNQGFDGGNSNETELGWTIGAGAKFAITDNVAIGAEYKYINFDFDGNGGNDGDFIHRHNRRGDNVVRHRHRGEFRNNDVNIDFHTVDLRVDFLF